MPLFYILKGIKTLFSGTDFYNILHIVNKDFSVSDVTSIQYFLCSFNQFLENRLTRRYEPVRSIGSTGASKRVSSPSCGGKDPRRPG